MVEVFNKSRSNLSSNKASARFAALPLVTHLAEDSARHVVRVHACINSCEGHIDRGIFEAQQRDKIEHE